MESQKYNGHANYETWVFNLYHERENFDNDIEYILENVSCSEYLTKEQNQLKMLEDTLEQYMDCMIEENQFHAPNMLNEFLTRSANKIDFREIAENYIEEYKENQNE